MSHYMRTESLVQIKVFDHPQVFTMNCPKKTSIATNLGTDTKTEKNKLDLKSGCVIICLLGAE